MANRCFVIMPFSGEGTPRNSAYWTDFFENFLKTNIESLGFQCERSTASNRNIIETLVGDLFSADIVLAVLTDKNPNVFYELGVRHTLSNGTIMIIEEGQELPFDLRHFGVIYYNRENEAKFTEELAKIIDSIKSKLFLDSPITEYLATNDISTIRISPDIRNTPLDTNGALRVATENLLMVGQNLHGLANENVKEKIFLTLLEKPSLHIRLLYADSEVKYQIQALSQIIDEVMDEQFPAIDATFERWIVEWRNTFPNDTARLQIRRCHRVGNISATLVDSERKTGMLLIRPVFYHTSSNNRPCHWLRRIEFPSVFDSYRNALEQIWSHGKDVGA